MAEDEDDGMFGDFKFVSYPNSNQNNNLDDDDWGDFVTTPTSTPSQDAFSISLQSQPSGKNLENSWEKPRGALPLSIFGDDDAVEDSSNEVLELFSAKSVSSARKGSSFGSGVSFNDIIGTLYSENGSKTVPNGKIEQIAVENGSDSNIFGNLNAVIEHVTVENGMNSNTVENSNGVIEQIKFENGSNSNLVEENGDFDEDDWEFKDAAHENSEFGVKKDENLLASWGIQVDSAPAAITTTSTATRTTPQTHQSESKNQESSKGAINGVRNNAQLDDDWFVTSQGNSYSPTVTGNGFHIESDVSTNNIWNPDSTSEPKQIVNDNGNNNSSLNGDFDFDESFGDFKDAFPTTQASNNSSEPKEELKIVDQAEVGVTELSAEDGFQVNGKASENDRGALPLSIFSDEKLESDEPLFGQDVFSFKPVTSFRSGIDRQVSNLSINDLISDLYSQAENIPAVGSIREKTENGFSSAETGLNSNLGNVEDDFDESSWEFKAAFSETKAEHASPAISLEHIQQKSCMKSKILNFVDFYSKLKVQSGFIILNHLNDLQDAHKDNAYFGEDAKKAALHEEIQIAHKKLLQENLVSEDAYFKKTPPRNICVNELLTTIKEPEFRAFESEYHLSQKISSAEQNLTSAITLFDHTISVLKLLNLSSSAEDHTTTWCKLISTCTQQLKHGATIWKKSLHKNLHNQILPKSQGQQYFLALGEIYRLVKILRLSAKIYKPWILLNSVEIFVSLDQCEDIWLNSGLDNALQSLETKTLLESIKSIHDLADLDERLLGDKVSSTEEICRISLLPKKILPDMEMVVWNGEEYFLKLANFWANLVSREPPKLPHIRFNL